MTEWEQMAKAWEREWEKTKLAEKQALFEKLSTSTIEIPMEVSLEDQYRNEELYALFNSEIFQANLEVGIQEIYERYAQLMVDFAQSICPVVTGFLRDSIYYIIEADGVTLCTDCPYGFRAVPAIQIAYAIYEPWILVEIDTLISSMLVVE